MNISLNKGEWSEFYVFLKILADGGIYTTSNTDKTFYKVSQIFLKNGKSLGIYDIYENTIHKNDTYVSKQAIKQQLKKIFMKIKDGRGSFVIPEADNIIKYLGYKSGGKSKTDITIVTKNPSTHEKNKVNLSIKSYIGETPTLLNASMATNFVFKITTTNKEQANGKLIEYIHPEHTTFIGMSSNVFRKNLQNIDIFMPEIISGFVLLFYNKKAKTIKELTKLVAESTFIKKISNDFNYLNIKLKIQNLLQYIALGMVPNTLWYGSQEIDGGYMVVEKSGTLTYYPINNMQNFSNFLFENTKLEQPSRKRHKYGKPYSENGKQYIKLNLQIRFI